VLRVLSMLPEKGSIRGLARAANHSQDTIKQMGIILILSEHKSSRYGPTLKKEKNLKDSDPFDYGDVYYLYQRMVHSLSCS
jgi:hypothetical protein